MIGGFNLTTGIEKKITTYGPGNSYRAMADAATPASSAQASSAAAGGAVQNGQGNGAHAAPPPLQIPQNTNPVPTSISSPMSGGDESGLLSPGGTTFRRVAPEPNKRALYVGGLDQRVTEDVLRQIFETTGHVQNVKIIPDKNVWQSP